jgi:hypothetical protein
MTLVDFLLEHQTATKAVIVAAHAAGVVVLFLMATRRGWWKPTGPATDWTTTDGCPSCWEHGPYPLWDSSTIASAEQARERHQAWHALTSALLGPAARWAERHTQKGPT